MPYGIRRQGSEHCVYKKGSGEQVACHETRAKAVAQIAALMMAEAKDRRAAMSAEFAELTQKQRDALSKSDFGDPERRLFPITDQEDVDSAKRLIGKARDPEAVKRRIVAICKRKGLKPPDAWMMAAEHSAEHSAAFDLDGEAWEDDGTVYRSGLLFRAGEYPDKSFAMTAEELQAAAAGFESCPLDLEHTPTILDGKLGEVVAVEAHGEELLGVVALPAWLDGALGDEERKVSATWNRETKRLEKLALVRSPRVTDAALLSAFAAHQTPTGQMNMQRMHDMATSMGAVCKPGSAEMASAGEAKALQQMHDLAVAQGAVCEDLSKKNNRPYTYYSSGQAPTGQPPENRRESRPAPARPGPRKETRGMSQILTDLKDRLLAVFAGIEEAGGTEETSTPPTETPPESPPAPAAPKPDPAAVFAAEIKALKDQLAQQARRSDEERARRIEAEAVSFAEGLLRDEKATPVEQAAIIAIYTQDARDDDAHAAEVTFGSDSEGQPLKGSRVAALRALFEARPKHILMQEGIPDGARALMNRTETHPEEKISDERIEELLKMTDLGRAVLAERKGGR